MTTDPTPVQRDLKSPVSKVPGHTGSSVGHLEYLEGIRGITALYVVIFHIVQGFLEKPEGWMGKTLFRFAAFGHEAVAVFIVLSGFCLTLSVRAQSGQTPPDLSLDLGRFVVRRSRRILPPYYAALFCSLAAIALSRNLRLNETGTIWDNSHPALGFAPILSHLGLVHNLIPELKFTINGPLWSVATEWQVYFLFAFLLLPLRRKLGPLPTFALSLALGYLPLAFWPTFSRSAVTWYLPLFTMGMLACLGTLKGETPERKWLKRVPLGRCAFLVTLMVGLVGLGLARWWFRFQPLSDFSVGLATSLVIAFLASDRAAGRESILSTILEQRSLVRLGRMSYSLYLTHLPVVAWVALFFHSRGSATRSPHSWIGDGLFQHQFDAVAPFLILGVGISASLLVAFVFFWTVERHTLSR